MGSCMPRLRGFSAPAGRNLADLARRKATITASSAGCAMPALKRSRYAIAYCSPSMVTRRLIGAGRVNAESSCSLSRSIGPGRCPNSGPGLVICGRSLTLPLGASQCGACMAAPHCSEATAAAAFSARFARAAALAFVARAVTRPCGLGVGGGALGSRDQPGAHVGRCASACIAVAESQLAAANAAGAHLVMNPRHRHPGQRGEVVDVDHRHVGMRLGQRRSHGRAPFLLCLSGGNDRHRIGSGCRIGRCGHDRPNA